MPSRWQAAGFSVRGARHVLDGGPCQDAMHIVETEDIVILAAADGHGDQKHYRSDEGAKIAVEVATELLTILLLDLLKEEERRPHDIERSLRYHLPRRISWEWNRRVKERAGLGNDGDWHQDLVQFGSTIMAVAITPKFGLFIQLGDGDIMLLNADGSANLIFDADEEMYGSLTHSLCQPNIALHTQICCRSWQEPHMVLLSTDGLRDSLQGDEEAYIQVGRWLSQRLESEGWNKVIDGLPSWLEEISRRGNGDDTTLVVVQWRGSDEE